MKFFSFREKIIMLVLVGGLFGLLCGAMIMDYLLFRKAGARFTAADGKELCKYHHALADYVHYSGPRPDCDYLHRDYQ
jgi:hypothetical protein